MLAYDKVAVTPVQYNGFQMAYDHFNRDLFSGALPNVLITLQRKNKCYGYFYDSGFSARDGQGGIVHEIALNPDGFNGRTDKAILSTLVHEMVHLWQVSHGKPGRKGYHNQQWANEMKRVGLQPTDTGAAGGKETGQNMMHMVMPAGLYETAYNALASSGFLLQWNSRPIGDEKTKKAKKASKTKYTCPGCQQNAWAKPEARLCCGDCDLPMEGAASEEDQG